MISKIKYYKEVSSKMKRDGCQREDRRGEKRKAESECEGHSAGKVTLTSVKQAKAASPLRRKRTAKWSS